MVLPIIIYGQAPTPSENYIINKIYRIPAPNPIIAPTIAEAIQVITYLDDSGRPKQKIEYQQSASGNNIIDQIKYDALGRPIMKYLPYPTQNNGLNYEFNAENDILSYGPYVGQNPFSEILYEHSPFQRVKKTSAPGADWIMGGGREIKYDYNFNTVADAVKRYSANAIWNLTKGLYDITLTEVGIYDPNILIKVVKFDENTTASPIESNGATIEFFNNEGQLILHRSYSASLVNNVLVSQPHDTYNVYDQYGNLTFVIPPMVDGPVTNPILNNLCYQYKYDQRDRLVEKKIPGKQWEFLIYDKLDRIVATGPTSPPFNGMVQKGWNIIKYDDYNRIVISGWITSAATITSATRKLRQDDRNLETIFSEERTQNTADVQIGGGYFYRYTNNVFPISGYHILQVNYYDDYIYPNPPLIPATIEGQPVYFNNTIKPRGLPTGKWERVISTSSSFRNETQYTLFDSKCRPLRDFKKNYENSPGGFTQLDRKFDFEGKVLSTTTTHKRTNSETALTIFENFTYTDQGRLLEHTHKINAGGIWQLLSLNTYDELGKLNSKEVGNISSTPLQKMDYKYNIRGWLTDINDIGNLSESNNNDDLFAFKLSFNNINQAPNESSSTDVPLYNGNIAASYWRSSDDIVRKYGYHYDKLNRLTNAIYQMPGSGDPEPNSFNEQVSYDKNGNIRYIQRYGDLEGILPPIEIDNLTYSYPTDSNELLSVSDNPITLTSGFIDGNIGNDYLYDSNGNLTNDLNKGVSIEYNHLNLPKKVVKGTSSIQYAYNASGSKIEKSVTHNGETITTKYLNGYHYIENILQFFPTSAGYVSKISNAFKYHFIYYDHLGNVRLIYNDTNSSGVIEPNELVGEHSYYPLGLPHSNSSTAGAYNYKYNGKEFQDELSLDLYDYGARNYDPAIGRFISIDPLADKFTSSTPYSYAYNNPVYYIDSFGLKPTPYEAALMSKHVYGDDVNLAGGWAPSLNTRFNRDSKNGLKSSMYERLKDDGSKEYTYVYAGTNDAKDAINNILQPYALSGQHKDVEILSKMLGKEFKDKELTLSGHSLGGGLAAYSALIMGRSAITFNPAWLSKIQKIQVQHASSERHRITNYVHVLDPLHRFQQIQGKEFGLEETGETFELMGDWYDSLITGHLIDQVIDAFEDNHLDYIHFTNEREHTSDREIPYLDRFLDTDLMRDNGIHGPED